MKVNKIWIVVGVGVVLSLGVMWFVFNDRVVFNIENEKLESKNETNEVLIQSESIKQKEEKENGSVFSGGTIQTADGWKMYKNERYGFSLFYPANWHIENSTIESIDQGKVVDREKAEFIIQLFDDEGKVAAVFFPIGGADHGYPPTTSKMEELFIGGKKVFVRESNDYIVYFFENYPTKESPFRIETNRYNLDLYKITQEIIYSLNFTM